MQNTGRSPLHLLLDDRASRDGACGSDRRRRARGPARQSRTLRRQEDQGRLGKEGRHRVQEAHRRHHARTEHDERVHAQTVQTARDAGRRGQAREPTGPRVRRLRPARASGGRSYLCPRQRGGLGVRVPAGRPGGQGHRRTFRRAGPGHGPGAGRVRHARLPADGRPGVPHRTGQRSSARSSQSADGRPGVPHRTGAANSTTRGSTSCSTCSTSKDRCRARATPTTTPWSNRRTGC